MGKFKFKISKETKKKSLLISCGSRTAATSKIEHKAFHLGCCSSPRSAPLIFFIDFLNKYLPNVEAYFEPIRTSTMESFCENIYWLLAVNCFYKETPSQMFHWALNTLLQRSVAQKAGIHVAFLHWQALLRKFLFGICLFKVNDRNTKTMRSVQS